MTDCFVYCLHPDQIEYHKAKGQDSTNFLEDVGTKASHNGS
jgi:hypothetical protein